MLDGYWIFNCRRVSERFSRSLDTPPSIAERLGFALHFMMCRYCARYRRQLLFIRRLMRREGDALSGEALSPAARERIQAAIATRLKR